MRDGEERKRPFRLDVFMRLLKAARIPEYSPEAVELIKSALQMRLSPPELPTHAEVSCFENAATDSDAVKNRRWASTVFGHILSNHRRQLAISIRSIAAQSGIESADIWRMEHGLIQPPQGDILCA
jgi:hypothetical protein